MVTMRMIKTAMTRIPPDGDDAENFNMLKTTIPTRMLTTTTNILC